MSCDRSAWLRVVADYTQQFDRDEKRYGDLIEEAGKEAAELFKRANDAKSKYEGIIAQICEEKYDDPKYNAKFDSWLLTELMSGNAVAFPADTILDMHFLPIDTEDESNRSRVQEVYKNDLTPDECGELYDMLKQRCIWEDITIERRAVVTMSAVYGWSKFATKYASDFDPDLEKLPNGKKLVIAKYTSWDGLWSSYLESMGPDAFKCGCWPGSCRGHFDIRLDFQCVYFKDL